MSIQITTDGSYEARKFVEGWISIGEQWKAARKKFTKKLNEAGINFWHIHNGWVSYNHQRPVDLKHVNRLIAIPEHYGNCFGGHYPVKGQLLALVKDAPTEASDEIKLYVYEVTNNKDFASSAIEYAIKFLYTMKLSY